MIKLSFLNSLKNGVGKFTAGIAAPRLRAMAPHFAKATRGKRKDGRYNATGKTYKILLGICFVTVSVFSVYFFAYAGNIDSPGVPASTGRMYTMQNIYNYLTSVNGKYSAADAKPSGGFAEPSSAPGTTMKTLDDIFAKITRLPATGQTTVAQTNDDGTYQSGSALSYSDNGAGGAVDGTVTDNNTKLMWVKQPELMIPGAVGVNATNQIPALDSHGDVVAKGNWATSTHYYPRDLVKATLYGSGPITATRAVTTGIVTASAPIFSAADIGREIYIGAGAGVSQGTVKSYTDSTHVIVTTAGATTSANLTIMAYYYCTTDHTSGTFLTDLAVPDWRESPWWATSTAYLVGDTVLAQQRDVGINATQATTAVTAASGTPFTTADIGRILFIGTTNCGYIVGLGTDALGASPNVAVKVSLSQAAGPANTTIYSTYVASTAHTSSGTYIYTNDSANWRETLWIWLMATTGIPTNNLTTPTKMRWDNQAIVNCEALNYGGTGAGYTDWRLPNLKELVSIANYGVATAPAIDTTKFPNTQSYYYWSSSTYASGPTGAWYVYFYDGDTGSGLSKTSAYCVRCVRGQ